MKTTILLATPSGLAVIAGDGSDWRGETLLAGKQVQCVAVDRRQRGVAYCGTLGNAMFKSDDAGATWKPCPGLAEPNITALAASRSGLLYAGTELSAVYRSDDGCERWHALETLSNLPSARGWSFPPRPETHHVQSILPDLAMPDRLHVAIEAGALLRSDDAGATWRDRVPSSPRDTHALAVHPQSPTQLFSAAGDGYFESMDDGESWRRREDGLEHRYCWSIAASRGDPPTLLLSAAKSAYQAHFKASANSTVYRRTGGDAWQRVQNGLPQPRGLRIPVLAASEIETKVFYCSAEGTVYRSEDDGLQWQKLAVQWVEGRQPEHALAMAMLEEE